MNNLYNTTKTRCAGLLSAIALITVCGTTALAQTNFGPFSASPALGISDDLYDGGYGSMAASSVTVSGVTGTSVVNISVDLQIAHTWPGDLVVKLVSPDYDVLTLFSRAGYAETADDGTGCCGLAADLTTEVLTFSDAGVTDGELMAAPFSSTYFPNPGITTYSTQTFTSLYGGTMNGNWTLYIGDAGSGDVGTLNAWSITITTASPSINMGKFVAVEDGNADCSDDALPAVSELNVQAGTNVCYFYIVGNTGDVAFSTHDLVDDQLGTILAGFPYLLNPGSSAFLPVMANITTEVTNIADWTAYNAGPTDVVTAQATATVRIIPANDECANAEVIACGDVVAGTNSGASEQSVPTYNGGSVGAGVWYVFTGTGNDVTLSTCNDATFDTEINVVTTSDCINFTNVAGNDDGSGCSGFSSLVTFTTVASQTYYVYVSDYVSGGGNTGTFNLTMTCVAPANDLCSNAQVIACGDVVAGSNLGATEQAVTTFNGFTVGTGVWYVFTGTGGDVTVSTCGAADFDTEINVITTADCMDYTNNVAGNDDGTGCGLSSEVTFTTVASQTYYVYVSDWNSGGGNQGTFNLSLTCDPVTGINEALENGISVYPNPSNGQFVLAVNGVDADAQIIVMDIAGRQIYTEGVTMNGSFRKELNLNLASGTYLLQVATVDGTVTRKIQIN